MTTTNDAYYAGKLAALARLFKVASSTSLLERLPGTAVGALLGAGIGGGAGGLLADKGSERTGAGYGALAGAVFGGLGGSNFVRDTGREAVRAVGSVAGSAQAVPHTTIIYRNTNRREKDLYGAMQALWHGPTGEAEEILQHIKNVSGKVHEPEYSMDVFQYPSPVFVPGLAKGANQMDRFDAVTALDENKLVLLGSGLSPSVYAHKSVYVR